MPQLAAHDEVRDRRTQRDVPGGHHVFRTDFIAAPAERPELPQAFLIESTPGHHLRTHFHEVDQFQVVVGGTATLAKHDVAPPGVHFARAYTPYGPIVSGSRGLGYLTLRARRDPLLAQYVPECNDKLKGIPGRAPWQKTVLPQLPELAPGQPAAMASVPDLDDGAGMGVHAMRLAPGASLAAPDPATTGGQFVVAMKGGIVHAGQLKPAITVVHVAAGEPAFTVQAGPDGADVLVFCFPRRAPGTTSAAPAAVATPATTATADGDFRTWQCVLCNFVYDEAAGLPEEGIAPGTRWADVPGTWGCPDCSATKADFEMVEI